MRQILDLTSCDIDVDIDSMWLLKCLYGSFFVNDHASSNDNDNSFTVTRVSLRQHL